MIQYIVVILLSRCMLQPLSATKLTIGHSTISPRR